MRVTIFALSRFRGRLCPSFFLLRRSVIDVISLECGRVGRFVSAGARGRTRRGMLEILNGLRVLAMLPI